ncbi:MULTISPECIES: aminotransferase class IV [unclassified Streptomyces]|uniref:aminotransferase class IV n=1 Tax=unclassified Streptomyces TaxID=2593676 RepID=UPI0001C18EAD|nr:MULTISPECIES: aminotransferase class IV [unclassified Streptomyces]AEN09832.1 aminotransferase class IV [Streptomyces sp. SirexAA-E]MYR64792.1 class IV aminotransferase [Streptomyces sp. SID4939]MYS01550.1 class IV aminotransferase [Streptomyces sp. SID4940]MYT64310.1 class IV aminotransferase [Streptomyces sp. SID8357]MYT87123.1 class IV aminotransferase [Streptomyces sp. SID8360]
MTTPALPPYVEMNGRPATAEDLRIPAFAGFGHFTAFQVRDREVRGLALHLDRLDAANRELFGVPLDGERVRALVGHALDGAGVRDASVRVHGYLPPDHPETAVMVTVGAAAHFSAAPQSLMSVPFARALPQVKRPGEFGQAYYRRRARSSGFDEALLTAPGGLVAEGAITNVGFWDGTSVVWPDAPLLTGVTMTLLEDGLARAGRPTVRRPVRLEGLAAYRAAFVSNSQGIAPVHRIDDTSFAVDEVLMRDLDRAYGDAPRAGV